jgi:hypothetical protein
VRHDDGQLRGLVHLGQGRHGHFDASDSHDGKMTV